MKQELLKPYLALYAGSKDDDIALLIDDLSITMEGNQAPSTITFKLADGDVDIGKYNYFLNLGKTSLKVDLGYYTVVGSQVQIMKERVFTGYADEKRPSGSKGSPRTITVSGSDVSVIARELIITGTLTGKTFEQIVNELLNYCYPNQKILVIDDRKKIENVLSYVYDSITFTNRSVWDAISELVNDFALDIYTDPNGKIHICEVGITFNQMVNVFRYSGTDLYNSNIASWNGMFKTPSSVVTKVIVRNYDDNEQVADGGESDSIVTPIDASAELTYTNAFQNRTEVVVNDKIKSQANAKMIATRRLSELMGQLKSLSFDSQYGIPNITNTSIIAVAGLGALDGNWWVRSVTHTYSKDGGYSMNLSTEPIPYFITANISQDINKYTPPKIEIPKPPANTDCPGDLGNRTFPVPGIIYKDTPNNRFGNRIHPVTGIETPHDGIDIGGDDGNALDCGKAVKAVYDGEVIVSNSNDGGGYGKYVEIAHPDKKGKWTTFYAHLSDVVVSVGQKVVSGDVIGYVGSTGTVSIDSNGVRNCHLHFELRRKDGDKVTPVNPVPCTDWA